MKTGKKLGALLLVLLMLAGMMTAVGAKEYTDLYNGLGSFDTKEMYDSFMANHVPPSTVTPTNGTTVSYNADNAAMELAYPSTGTSQGRMHFYMKAEKGKTYSISFRIKAADSATTSVWLYSDEIKPRISLGSTSEETGDMNKSFAISNSDWTNFVYTFTYTGETKENAKFFFVHKAGNGYDYLVDDLCVAEIADSPIVNKTQEILNRAFDSEQDFEMFRRFELNSLSSAEVSIQYDEAAQAMKVTHESKGQGRVRLNSISYEKGATYTVSYKAKAAVEGGTPKMSYYIDSGHTFYRYQDGSFENEDPYYTKTLNSSDWTDVSFSFTYTGETKNFSSFFYFPTQADSNTDDYYIKDLVITKYIPDYPELKVTVEEQDAYISGETVKHTVYGVKDSVETPITDEVTYKSSDSAVVKVNADGSLSAVGVGTATVTAVYDLVPVQFDVTIASVDGRLDLSKTEKTVLSVESPNNTSQIIVDVVYSTGTQTLVDENGTESKDIAFTTSDSTVATVSESGLVTAKKEGTAVITASYDEVSKSIVMMIGTGTEKGYESASDYTSKTGNETFETTAEKVRSGSQSLKVNIGKETASYSNAITLIQDTTSMDNGSYQIWFYDDMSTYTAGKDMFFQIMGSGDIKDENNETVVPRVNAWLEMDTQYKVTRENGQLYTVQNLTRSKGWHQLVAAWTQDEMNIYVDGICIASRSGKEFTDRGKQFYTNKIILQKFKANYTTKGDSGLVWLDDVAKVDTTVKHDVTMSVGANGTVKNGDAEIADGDSIAVTDGESLTLTLVPDNGYRAKVAVDGQEVAVQEDNTVTVSDITADKAVEVTFEQVITAPAISGSSADYIISQDDYSYNNEKHFAYVAYYKAAVPASYKVKEMGMNFGDGTSSVPLTVTQWTTDYMFGIRVFGDAVKKGNSYTFQGYAVMEDDDGQETTVTTGEPISK